jgi:pimeloyl-ACP methyl ester carboxylesterase
MKPVIFDDCSGWLHRGGGRHGVVLCNPFGQEAYATHRGWRMLAERASAAGMTVLRFDYPGTGDSAGGEIDPSTLEAWVQSIVAAVRWLRAHAGVDTVSLVGIRLGATLAALAASRLGEIDGLVLLAPVVTGRGYLRELRMQRRKWVASWPGVDSDSPGDETHLSVLGYALHADDVERLTEFDLRRDARAPARRALILDTHPRGDADALAQHYASLGVEVARDAFDEYDRFLAEPLQSRPPHSALERTVRWLAAGAASSCARESLAARAANDNGKAVLHLAASHATERPIVFGPYFGIYCEPHAVDRGMPAVLIVNTSAGHHIGDGRMSVLLARRLASQGIASLRMDLGGLGDATPAAKDVTVDSVFSEQACRDAIAGAEWLTAKGHRSLIAFGVCSGAYVSLHLCARHSNVVGAYTVNVPKFSHRPAAGPELALWKVYRQSLLKPHKWLGVFRGQRTNPLVIARGLCYDAARRGKFALMQRLHGEAQFGVRDPQVRLLLRKLHDKHARVRMIFGERDVGLPVATAHLGEDFTALRHCPSLSAVVLPKLDHAVIAPQARSAVLSDMDRWLRSEWLSQRMPAEVGAAEAASV